MKKKIAIIGLGYVGLPLAVEFGQKYRTVGYDLNKKRVKDLGKGLDDTLEVDTEYLKKTLKNKLFEVKSVINEHDKFVSQYIATPTERKITRFKIRVVNNINSSLQDLNIPKTIVKDFNTFL